MNALAFTVAAPLIIAAIAFVAVLVRQRRRPLHPTATQESNMTKKVKIENADTYPADLLVTSIDPATGVPLAADPVIRVKPGETAEAWVHFGKSLRIDEVSPESSDPQGGGGPGEER